jgi:hypothetical protein
MRHTTASRVRSAIDKRPENLFDDNAVLIETWINEGLEFTPEQTAAILKSSPVSTVVRELYRARKDQRNQKGR